MAPSLLPEHLPQVRPASEAQGKATGLLWGVEGWGCIWSLDTGTRVSTCTYEPFVGGGELEEEDKKPAKALAFSLLTELQGFGEFPILTCLSR